MSARKGVGLGVRAILCGLALTALAACEPPVESARASLTVAEDRTKLTPAAEATLAKLKDIAANGDYRDMARLADAYAGFRSNAAGWKHGAYWYLKMRAGDWPTKAMGRVLGYRHGVMETVDGRVFVWPYIAQVKGEAVTPSAAHDMDQLAGVGEAARMRKGGVWSGYSLGVREDGTWLWFTSGAEEAELGPPGM